MESANYNLRIANYKSQIEKPLSQEVNSMYISYPSYYGVCIQTTLKQTGTKSQRKKICK